MLIKEQAVVWSVASASPEEIAELNILHATMLAMTRAVQGLVVVPDKVLIDGNRVPKDLGIPAEAIVKGDSKIIEISAASVLAKTARDAEMYALARQCAVLAGAGAQTSVPLLLPAFSGPKWRRN